MAEFAKKLRVKAPDGTTQAITIYSTTGECGYSHIEYCKVDGVPGYMAGDPNGNSRVAYKEHNGATGKLMLTGKPPYGKAEYRNPGTYTFTVPRGINKLKVEVAGAGGGGGTGYYYKPSSGRFDPDVYKGGDGGRGAKVNTTLAVTAGQTVKVVVGSGGSGGAGSTAGGGYGTEGGKGGTSTVHNINAEGGNGGKPAHYDKGDGANGSNAGNGQGAAGGAGPYGTSADKRPTGARGDNGWVIIEYGGDI